MTDFKISDLAGITSLDEADLFECVHLAEGTSGSKKITLANLRTALLIGAVSFTTIAASGQITSTVATGTAPFVVASTTVVANLHAANSDALGGATFAAPGAIGGTTPAAIACTTLTASGLIQGTVADASYGLRLLAASGKYDVYPWYDGTLGVYIASTNIAGSLYQPITWQASAYSFLSGAVTFAADIGVGITPAGTYGSGTVWGKFVSVGSQFNVHTSVGGNFEFVHRAAYGFDWYTGAGAVLGLSLVNGTLATGYLHVKHTLAATSTTDAALRVDGGLGVVGAGYFGAGLYCTALTATDGPIFVGKNTGGAGGNGHVRYIDDSGAQKWLSGILGSAAARNFSIYDIVNGERLSIDGTTGAITCGTINPASVTQICSTVTGDLACIIKNDSATGYGLRLRGGASGAGFIQEWQNYAGTTKASMSADGGLSCITVSTSGLISTTVADGTTGFKLQRVTDDSQMLFGYSGGQFRIAATYGTTGAYKDVTIYTGDVERLTASAAGVINIYGTTPGTPGSTEVRIGNGQIAAGGNILHGALPTESQYSASADVFGITASTGNTAEVRLKSDMSSCSLFCAGATNTTWGLLGGAADDFQIWTNATLRLTIASGGAATFVGTVQSNAALIAYASTAILQLDRTASGNACEILFRDMTGTRYNWLISTQYNVDNGWEITPSTAVGGSTYSTPCIMGSYDGSSVKIGFLGTAPIARPTATGSRGGNAALASLITALANLGLITDSTSA